MAQPKFKKRDQKQTYEPAKDFSGKGALRFNYYF